MWLGTAVNLNAGTKLYQLRDQQLYQTSPACKKEVTFSNKPMQRQQL